MDTKGSSWNLTEGDHITPQLTAVKLLGGGNTYEAWLAFDEVTWMPVVVKLVRPDRVEDESSLCNLRREVLGLKTVNHPVVVRGLRSEETGPRPHVVLEQIDGPRLSSLIRRHGHLQAQQYLPLACDIAAALHYFTAVGWTHLDIKPSNVIMGAPARLIDLSVARPEPEARVLTTSIGTDAYMAPEQGDPGRDGHVPSFASDIWGLGATLFHAVTGERPFPAGEPDAEDVVRRFPQLVSTPAPLPDDLHPTVAEVITSCLSRNPADRPLPHEVSDALSPVLANLPRGSLSGFKIRR